MNRCIKHMVPGKSLQQAGLHSQMHIIGNKWLLLEEKINYLVCLTDMDLLPITISSSACSRERKDIKMKSLVF